VTQLIFKNEKVKVAALSIASNSVLIVMKLIAGIISGSVSIISEAIHSGMDLAASIIAFFSVNVSSKPADESHPYGHGKIENVSGVVEGLLIFVAAFLIIKESIVKIANPGEIHETNIAIIVMVISGIVNFFVSRKIYKVAKEEDSIALEADALHLKTDVYTSLGVAGGLILIKLTGIAILDPIAAICVALLILKEAYHLSSSAFRPLLDERLSDEEERFIKSVIAKYEGEIIDFHNLKTRKSGHIKHVDFHITIEGEVSVSESHRISKEIEKTLEREIRNTMVHIHIDPSNLPKDH
jgi:cation diffusion facilitator family transporter